MPWTKRKSIRNLQITQPFNRQTNIQNIIQRNHNPQIIDRVYALAENDRQLELLTLRNIHQKLIIDLLPPIPEPETEGLHHTGFNNYDEAK